MQRRRRRSCFTSNTHASKIPIPFRTDSRRSRPFGAGTGTDQLLRRSKSRIRTFPVQHVRSYPREGSSVSLSQSTKFPAREMSPWPTRLNGLTGFGGTGIFRLAGESRWTNRPVDWSGSRRDKGPSFWLGAAKLIAGSTTAIAMILALFLRLGPGYLFCELLGAGIIIAAGILMWLVRRDQSRDNQAMQKFLDAERIPAARIAPDGKSRPVRAWKNWGRSRPEYRCTGAGSWTPSAAMNWSSPRPR